MEPVSVTKEQHNVALGRHRTQGSAARLMLPQSERQNGESGHCLEAEKPSPVFAGEG
jgi:hypothetical protein